MMLMILLLVLSAGLTLSEAAGSPFLSTLEEEGLEAPGAGSALDPLLSAGISEHNSSTGRHLLGRTACLCHKFSAVGNLTSDCGLERYCFYKGEPRALVNECQPALQLLC
jgi:hypothetical protein